MRIDENFGFEVSVAVHGIDTSILNPRDTCADKKAYDVQATKLVGIFIQNFEKFLDYVDPEVKAAAPKVG